MSLYGSVCVCANEKTVREKTKKVCRFQMVDCVCARVLGGVIFSKHNPDGTFETAR